VAGFFFLWNGLSRVDQFPPLMHFAPCETNAAFRATASQILVWFGASSPIDRVVKKLFIVAIEFRALFPQVEGGNITPGCQDDWEVNRCGIQDPWQKANQFGIS
jgi:hypothetical protein